MQDLTRTGHEGHICRRPGKHAGVAEGADGQVPEAAKCGERTGAELDAGPRFADVPNQDLTQTSILYTQVAYIGGIMFCFPWY